MANDRLHEVAAAVLAVVEGHFASAPVAIDLPARRYVANGYIAFDCEQVAVEVVRLFSGAPGAERVAQSCVQLNVAEARVWLIRCVPSSVEGKAIPSVEALAASGETILTDLLELQLALARAGKADAIERAGLLVTGAAPIKPQGGLGGSVATIHFSL